MNSRRPTLAALAIAVLSTAAPAAEIPLDVSGAPPQTAPGQTRGFIGVVFRLQADGSHFENIYIRPTNGRADDQLRRNHSTQYVSAPDWPWERRVFPQSYRVRPMS